MDDDEGLRESCRLILEEEFDVLDAPDAAQGLETLRRHEVDVVLLDVRLPGMDGLEALQHIKALDEHVEVILVTAVRTVRTAVTAMKLGAFDYLTKPFEEEEVLGLVRRALDRRALQREVTFLRSELARRENGGDIVGQAPEMRRLFQFIAQVARTNATVLITGESGTGKELVARAIHRQSPRREKPFVPVNPRRHLREPDRVANCSATSAAPSRARSRRSSAASSSPQAGTLFLDEIGTLKAELQAKLLRVLQEREIERVGGTRSDRPRRAHHRGHQRRPEARGRRRRPSARTCTTGSTSCPSQCLRCANRREDIGLLVDHFIGKYNRQFGKHISGVSPDALATLSDYDWPGNVRELQNIIERSVALVEGPLIQTADLPVEITLGERHLRQGEVPVHPLGTALEQFERNLILRVLERSKWNQSKAAAVLGLHRNTLLRKIAKWGLSAPNLD